MNIEIQNVTCPLCGTDGFEASGLRAHNCNGVNRRTGQGVPFTRRKLTPAEFVTAVQKAKADQERTRTANALATKAGSGN